MAEIVHYRVDKTKDEMRQLQQLGVFNHEQIKTITKRRTDFEYKLRRRTRTKLEYLKYIQFEINFLESIDKYRKLLIEDYHKNKSQLREDHELVEKQLNFLKGKQLGRIVHKRAVHVSALFRQLCLKHQFDEKLWLAYIDFAHSRRWHNRVSALYWRMLKVNGQKESLWLKAARYEMKHKKSYDICRGLLQRSLRHHPRSVLLWSEYFAMEMKFIHLIDRRHQVLLEKKSNKLKFGVGEDSSDSSDDEDNDDIQLPAEKLLDGDDAVLRGDIVMVVLENGSKTLKPSQHKMLQFFENCLKTCNEFVELNSERFRPIGNNVRDWIETQHSVGNAALPMEG